MSDGVAEYQQVASEGATNAAGCPEQRVIPGTDPACTGHFILMASPTLGTHVLCTAQDAAAKLGFRVGLRDQLCSRLTAADGIGDPDRPLPGT